MSKSDIYSEVKSFLLALSGFVLLSIVINLFSWQFKLVSGGFPGFGLFISYVTKFSVGQVLLYLNILILVLLFTLVGKKVGIKSAVGYLGFPMILDFTRGAMNLVQQDTPRFLTSAIYISVQGLIAGIAVTLFFSQKYSAGGWGALAFVAGKYFSISGPAFLLFMDIVLTILVSVFFSLTKGLLLAINSIVFYNSFKYTLKYFENRFLYDKK